MKRKKPHHKQKEARARRMESEIHASMGTCRKCASESQRGKSKCGYCGADFMKMAESGAFGPDLVDIGKDGLETQAKINRLRDVLSSHEVRISPDPDVELDAALEEIQRLHETGQLVCDFCTSPDVKFAAVTAPFSLDTCREIVEQMSVDDWALCPICADMVRAGDKVALAERARDCFTRRYAALIAADPHMAVVRDTLIADTSEKFWKYFMGEIYEETFEISEAQREVNKEAAKQWQQLMDDWKGRNE